jgi:hypothetical protein
VAKNSTFFLLNLKTTPLLRTHTEGINPLSPIRKLPFKADSKMRWMPGGPSPDFIDSSPFSERVLQGCVKGLGNQTQGIEEIAFSCPILPDKKR